jgi:tetratricopeptide (TPR) repeat protein
MSDTPALKYRAFLSYSHKDTATARRVHSRLEAFNIDKDIAGRETPLGPIPKTLRPVFRDRHDFSAGSALTGQTAEALDASAALILIASPDAALSKHVNEEVRLFKSRHPERPVIPLIAERASGDIESTCFPAALRFEVTADGAVTETPAHPLAADLRESGDGRELALAKVVARLIGLTPDEVFRRAERERRQRQRNWIIGLGAVAVVLAALTVWAEINRRKATENLELANHNFELANRNLATANRNFESARGAASGLVFDVVQELRDVTGMRSDAIQKILQTAKTTFDTIADSAPDDDQLQWSRSVLLTEFGDTYKMQGNLPEALKSYQEGFAIREKLAKANPADAGWQRGLSLSYDELGDVQDAQGHLPEALGYYRRALEISEALAKSQPDNAGWQRDLGISEHKVGDIVLAQHKPAEALKYYQATLAIDQRLAAADPQNGALQRDLSIAQNKVGEVQVALNNLPEALKSYSAGLAIRQRLVDNFGYNSGWQRDLSTSYEKVGEVMVRLNNLPDAIKAYRDSLAIREKLANTDLNNAIWLRDVSASYGHLGFAFHRAGQLRDAQKYLAAGREILAHLLEQHPDQADWKSDLAWFDDQIAATKR